MTTGKGITIGLICALPHFSLRVRTEPAVSAIRHLPSFSVGHEQDFLSLCVTGQQAEVRPAAGEGVQGEDQPVLHVRRAREEDPRVQTPAAQLPAHHRHVQP